MEDFKYINKMLQKALDAAQKEMLNGYNNMPESSLKDRCKIIMNDINLALKTGDASKYESLKQELIDLQKIATDAREH